MKQMFLAAAVFCLVATGAQADTRFFGSYIVKSVSGTCPEDPSGERGLVRFGPKVNGERASASLSFFNRDQALGFVIAEKNFPIGSAAAARVNTMAIFEGFEPLPDPVFIKFRSQTPKAIGANTGFLDIVAQVKGYAHMKNCTSVIHISLIRR